MLSISGSVGKDGLNRPEDVALIRQKLVALGFDWIASATNAGPELVSTILLFQSIKEGLEVVGATPNADGRVDVNGDTLAWLNAVNAPRWMRMTPEGVGFLNWEAKQLDDDHDFGTSWLDETVRAAARIYEERWRRKHDAAPIVVNDTSRPRGGPTPSHKGHQTGLLCDIRLPRLGGLSGGITTQDATYDRHAMRAQLHSLRDQSRVSSILLNDDLLISEGLCLPCVGHDDHAHVKIQPPQRILP
jgi:hypothetical protein